MARNLYAYVGNDPLNRVSSTGLASDSPLPPEESNSNLPSPFRYTAPGESFLRYESDNPNFSRIRTKWRGSTPGTFAAPSSEGQLEI